MSVINPNETARSWRADRKERSVQLYLTGAEGDAAALIGARVLDLPLTLNILPVTDWIDPEELGAAVAGIIQVDADTPASIKRFERLVKASEAPLIAAAYEPPLALVRSLIRAGAHDVIPLPLDMAELEASVAPIRAELSKRGTDQVTAPGKLVSVIKSVGGAGATSLLGQLAIRFANNERVKGREACLIDLDIQFGNAAFQLGLRPSLSIADVLDAGSRVDGDMLRSVAVQHPSGLHVIAAPEAMIPLESLTSDQVIQLAELAGREFGTVFVDLPASWTNWSLSLLARSSLILMVTELSVTGLHRARRQLDLIRDQELEDVELRVVANQFEKSAYKTIRPADVHKALGRDIAYTIANEPSVMQVALDQGIPIDEVKRRSAISKDIDQLDSGIAALLGLGR